MSLSCGNLLLIHVEAQRNILIALDADKGAIDLFKQTFIYLHFVTIPWLSNISPMPFPFAV